MLIPYIICSILTLPGYLIIFTLMWLLSIFVFFYIKIRYGERAVFLDSADTLFALKETYHNVSKLLLILNGNIKDEDIEANAKRVIQERLFKYPDKFGRLMCSVHMFLGKYGLAKKVIKNYYSNSLMKRNCIYSYFLYITSYECYFSHIIYVCIPSNYSIYKNNCLI